MTDARTSNEDHSIETAFGYKPHRKRTGFRVFVALLNTLSALLIILSPLVIVGQMIEGNSTAGPWLTLTGGFLLGGTGMVLEILSDIEASTRLSSDRLSQIVAKRRS